MNQKLKIIAIVIVLAAAVTALFAYLKKEEGSSPSDTSAATYCWDLQDGWQMKFPGAWKNNCVVEKAVAEQGNVSTFYYAPNGKKTDRKLLIIGVMTKEKWAAITEASRPGTLLEERDGSVYYASYPNSTFSFSKQYKQMLAEAKEAKFQTIKKTPNLPSVDQPIMGSSGMSASGTSDTGK